MRIKRYILLIMYVCACVCTYAQSDTIRYVHPDGAYNNDGKSWEKAFNRVQDAINSLRDYLESNPGVRSGSVYIASGNYIPTESTESSGGSMLNTAFKIYAGIHVYGGFNAAAPEAKPGDRIMANGKKCSENWANKSGIGTVSGILIGVLVFELLKIILQFLGVNPYYNYVVQGVVIVVAVALDIRKYIQKK